MPVPVGGRVRSPCGTTAARCTIPSTTTTGSPAGCTGSRSPATPPSMSPTEPADSTPVLTGGRGPHRMPGVPPETVAPAATAASCSSATPSVTTSPPTSRTGRGRGGARARVPPPRRALDRRCATTTRPPHLGVLLDNTAEYLFWLGAAALDAVGDRRDQRHLPRRRARAARRLHRLPGLVTSDTYADLLADAPSHVPADRVLHTGTDAYAQQLAARRSGRLEHAPAEPDDLYLLIFTSGSTGFPKAVRCTQGRFARTGVHVKTVAELGPGQGGVRAAPVLPLELAVHRAWRARCRPRCRSATRARFSASNTMPDIRRDGRHDARLHRQGPQLHPRGAARARRRHVAGDVRVRQRGVGGRHPRVLARASTARCATATAPPRGSSSSVATRRCRRARSAPPTTTSACTTPRPAQECPRAEFDAAGRLANTDAAVGEIVNTEPGDTFEGYYRNEEANVSKVRDGIYWSGDLAYRDADGWFFFAGRSNEWLRVDGENFAAAPVERIVLRAAGRAFGRGVRGARRPGRRPGDGGGRGRRPDDLRPRTPSTSSCRRSPTSDPSGCRASCASRPSCRSWRA